MVISQESTTGPSAESLSLSASLFTSQISSWIPANFGQSSKSESTAQTQTKSSLDSVLQTEHDRGERLGLGHPLLDVPKHQRRQETSSSLSTLGKRMGLDVKGKGKAKEGEEDAKESKVESEDEKESRARIGKKRKVEKVDMFAGKKKAKPKPKIEPVVVPTPLATYPPSPCVETSKHVEPIPETPHPHEPSPKKSSNEATTTNPSPTLDGLNKNQRKKLRKKQKKMALV